MTTDFFIKRRWLYCVAACLFTMIFSITAYAWGVARAQFVVVGKSFYFLVSADTHIQSATHATRLDGGAGYLLTDGESQYTAYSVYLTVDIARTVQAGMQEDVLLVEKRVDYLAFRRKYKENADVYQGALNALYGCIGVLTQTISRLENGETQESCKRILQILGRQFGYMSRRYQTIYPAFAAVCKDLQSGVNAMREQVVFCKDLRYLLCLACDEYVRLASVFSL